MGSSLFSSWVFFAILSPAIYSIVNFVDKYLLERKIKDYRGMPIFGSIVGFIFGTVFWLSTGLPTMNTTDILIVVLTGALTIWGAAFYFKAMSIEQASIVILLYQLTSILTLIFSSYLLNERITYQQTLGFFIIFFALLGVSIKKERSVFGITPSLIFMLIADILWAFSYVLLKFVIEKNSFVKIVSYESFGIALGGIILYFLFPSIKNAFLKTTRSVGVHVIGVVFVNELIFIIAKMFFFFAVSLGPVSLVSVLSGTQVFFGILYGLLLTLIFPKIFKEETSRKGIFRKIFLAIVLFVGLFLIR